MKNERVKAIPRAILNYRKKNHLFLEFIQYLRGVFTNSLHFFQRSATHLVSIFQSTNKNDYAFA